MTSSVAPAAERLERLDREIEELKAAFVDAASALGGSREVDSTFDERFGATAQRLRDLRSDLFPEDYDKAQLAELMSTLLDTRDLMDRDPDDLDVIDGLLIDLERIRHVVRDALDEHVSGVADDKGLVVTGLLEALPHTPQEAIAEIVGVDRRTLHRWRSSAGRPSARLRTVARLVAILRHNWNEEGTVAWFHRSRRDLGGAKPITFLTRRALDEEALITAARAGRSQVAS